MPDQGEGRKYKEAASAASLYLRLAFLSELQAAEGQELGLSFILTSPVRYYNHHYNITCTLRKLQLQLEKVETRIK